MSIQEERSDHSRAQGIVLVTQAPLSYFTLDPTPVTAQQRCYFKRQPAGPPRPWSQGQPEHQHCRDGEQARGCLGLGVVGVWACLQREISAVTSMLYLGCSGR